MIARYSIALNAANAPAVLGLEDRILRRMRIHVRSHLSARGNKVFVEGPPEEEKPLRQVFRDLEEMASRGVVQIEGLETALTLAGFHAAKRPASRETIPGTLVFERPGLRVFTRSVNQEEYVHAMHEADLTFSVGPAGTGKTYLAVAEAVRALFADEVERIILVRPMVEAGENLGYLPGDIREKVEPYFRPLYDALMEMIPPDKLKRYMDQSLVEVAPLAYMRGRTLSKAFVILDEAQNTTSGQLKMFLTRLGLGSKAVVTGDLTQVDLVDKHRSGLADALQLLAGIKGIRFVTLDQTDVVRHMLVREIIQAYERDQGGRA